MLEELRTIIAIEGITPNDGLEARSGRLNLTDNERKERRKRQRILARAANPEKYKKTRAAYRERNREKIRKRDRDNAHKYAEKKKIYIKKYSLLKKEYIRNKTKEYREKNKERLKQKSLEYYTNNKEKFREYHLKRYPSYRESILLKLQQNREFHIERCRLWRLNNEEKLKIYRKKYQPISNKKTSIYRASKVNAIPKWLTLKDFEEINNLYKECSLLNSESNIKYSVDHFYPLNSDWVCGLHCPSNLRIVTASLNSSKNNRRTEEHLNA